MLCLIAVVFTGFAPARLVLTFLWFNNLLALSSLCRRISSRIYIFSRLLCTTVCFCDFFFADIWREMDLRPLHVWKCWRPKLVRDVPGTTSCEKHSGYWGDCKIRNVFYTVLHHVRFAPCLYNFRSMSNPVALGTGQRRSSATSFPDPIAAASPIMTWRCVFCCPLISQMLPVCCVRCFEYFALSYVLFVRFVMQPVLVLT